MGCHFLLQRIFPTLGSNPGLPHCRQTLYCLSHRKFILVTGIFQVSDINFASQAPSLWVVVHLLSHVRLFNPMDCMQNARLPCPSLSPGICSNSCPLSWWCHPAILLSVALFSSYPQSFPASGSFSVSRLFASGGQSIGASASASALPRNIQD